MIAPSQNHLYTNIDSLNIAASSHYQDYDMANAMSDSQKALELSKQSEYYKGRSLAVYNLGLIFNNLDETERSQSYLLEAVEFAKMSNQNYLASMAKIQLAELHLAKNDFSEDMIEEDIIDFDQDPPEYILMAIELFKDAMIDANKHKFEDPLGKSSRSDVLFLINLGLARSYLRLNELSLVFENLDKSRLDIKKFGVSNYNLAYYNFILGKYYYQSKLYSTAAEKFYKAKNALTAQEKTITDKKLLSNIYKIYAATLEGLGRDKFAYKVLREYSDLKEHLVFQERIKHENIAKAKLDLANYKKEAELADLEMHIQSDLKDRALLLNYIVVFAALILLGSSIFFYKNYRAKLRLARMFQIRNEQLVISKEKALTSAKLKSEFISNVSHELRTPLYGVVGLTSLLISNNSFDEEDKKILTSLKFSADYLLNLVNDVLQIGKIEANKVEIIPSPTNLRIMIQNLIESLKFTLDKNNNNLLFEFDERLPKIIKLDANRISQILINLLSNSMKFTENGKIRLKIKVLDISANSCSLRFSVKDNGPGIPKEKQTNIFQKFTQVSDKDDANSKGSGLGLAISNEIAKLLGSNIELISDQGMGCEFRFDLSCDIVDIGTINNSSLIYDDKNRSLKTVNGSVKILVAEDNKINQIVTKNMLKKSNFECDVVENGLEALEAAKTSNYDLILMDINMPVMNGKDATLEIRKINNNIPIFALTAADIEEVKNDSKSIGFDEIVIKPFDQIDLFQKIHKAIYRSRQHLRKDDKIRSIV